MESEEVSVCDDAFSLPAKEICLKLGLAFFVKIISKGLRIIIIRIQRIN